MVRSPRPFAIVVLLTILVSTAALSSEAKKAGTECEDSGRHGITVPFETLEQSLQRGAWPLELAPLLDELTSSWEFPMGDVRLLAVPGEGLQEVSRNNYTAYILENQDARGFIWGNEEKVRGTWLADKKPVSLIGTMQEGTLCMTKVPTPVTTLHKDWDISTEDSVPAPSATTAAQEGSPIGLPPNPGNLIGEATCLLNVERSTCTGEWEDCGPDPAEATLFICAIGDVDFCEELTVEGAFDKMADNAFRSYSMYNLQGQAGMSTVWLVCWIDGDYYDHSKTDPGQALDDFSQNNPFGVVEPGIMHLFSSYVNEISGVAGCAGTKGVGGYPSDALNSQYEYELLLHETGHNYNGGHETGLICGYNGAAVLDIGENSIMHTGGIDGTLDMTFTDGSNNAGGRDNLGRIQDDWSSRGVVLLL